MKLIHMPISYYEFILLIHLVKLVKGKYLAQS
jgi:hypothetical protein